MEYVLQPYTIGSFVVGIVLAIITYWCFTPYTRSSDEILGKEGKRRTGQPPPVYPNGWFKVAYSHELHKKQVKYVNAVGQSLAVYRGEDGKPYILDAYCPHLGANLGVGGVVKGSCIECPFHFWCFDGKSGNCVKIPYEETVPSVAKTKSWPVHEVNGMVLVWYDVDGNPPAWYPPDITGITSGAYAFHGYVKNRVNAHIQELPENGADIQHLPALHNRLEFPLVRHIIGHKWEGTWKAGEDDKKHTAVMDLDQSMTIGGWKIPGSSVISKATQVGPSLVQIQLSIPLGKVYILESVTPIEPMLQQFDAICFATTFVPRFVAKLVFIGFLSQYDRDLPVWNNKVFLHAPMLTKNEKPIQQFRRWFSQFYSPNSPTLASLRTNGLDW